MNRGPKSLPLRFLRHPLIPACTACKLARPRSERIGLDIEVTITPLRSTSHYGRAAAATRAGAVPTYDTIEGAELVNAQLIGIDGTQKIDGWESLIAKINPQVGSGKVRPEQISPDPFTGHAFKHYSRVKGIIFNPKLISRKELPIIHADLSYPKYKDRWTQPPWSSHWELGPPLSTTFWISQRLKPGGWSCQSPQVGVSRQHDRRCPEG